MPDHGLCGREDVIIGPPRELRESGIDRFVPLNEDVAWILGRPNFWCGRIAVYLRRLGRAIPETSESEQAVVIHWMLGLWWEHGEAWREVASKEIAKLKEATGKDAAQASVPVSAG